MPKRTNPEQKGGRGKKSPDKPKNAGIALTQEVRDALSGLPQIKSGEWSKSYFVEQLIRIQLGLPAHYDRSDLELIAKGQIVE